MAGLVPKPQASGCSSTEKLDIFYTIGYIKMGNKYPINSLPPQTQPRIPPMYLPYSGDYTTMGRFGRNLVFDTVRTIYFFQLNTNTYNKK